MEREVEIASHFIPPCIARVPFLLSTTFPFLPFFTACSVGGTKDRA